MLEVDALGQKFVGLVQTLRPKMEPVGPDEGKLIGHKVVHESVELSQNSEIYESTTSGAEPVNKLGSYPFTGEGT